MAGVVGVGVGIGFLGLVMLLLGRLEGIMEDRSIVGVRFGLV